MTYKKATNSPEAAQWTGAIHYELKAHKENNTWKLKKDARNETEMGVSSKEGCRREVTSIQGATVYKGFSTTRGDSLQGNLFSCGEIRLTENITGNNCH